MLDAISAVNDTLHSSSFQSRLMTSFEKTTTPTSFTAISVYACTLLFAVYVVNVRVKVQRLLKSEKVS